VLYLGHNKTSRTGAGHAGTALANPPDDRSVGVMVDVYFTTYRLTSVQIKRFWQRVPHETDPTCCWDWQGRIGKNGYGYMDVGPPGDIHACLAHCIAWELHVGTVPDGLELDHLCMRKPCVNIAHLEPVTHQVNGQRAMARLRPLGQVSCNKGHLLTADTVYYYTKSSGMHVRQCKACAIERAERRHRERLTTEPGYLALSRKRKLDSYHRNKGKRHGNCNS
jgi:hypothetical protein